MMNTKLAKGRVTRALVALSVAVSLFTITTGGVSAEKVQQVRVKVNGTTIITEEAPAYISAQNFTMVPLRFVSEALDAKVTWNNTDKSAKVEVSEPAARKITVTLNAFDIMVEAPGEPVLFTAAGTPATMKNNRVMVPLRVISEGLGATVGFSKSGEGGVVTITTPWKTPLPATPKPTTSVVKDEYTTWTPTNDQKVTGPVVFKPLKWDAGTRTLSFKLPSTIKHGGEDWEVSSGLTDGSKPGRKLETGVTQTLVGLDERFMVTIYIDYLPRFAGIDKYYVMSKQYAKVYGYDGPVDDGLVVYDSHKNIVTLETVYKALGIAN